MTERKKITLKTSLSAEKLAELEKMKNPQKSIVKKPFVRPEPRPSNHTPPITELGRTVKWLYKTYPDLFLKERNKPLKRHIDKDILAAFGDKPPVTKRMLKKALSHYVYSYPYMNGVLAATGRYDLKGEFVEDLTDEHKTFAIDWLRGREEEESKKKDKI